MTIGNNTPFVPGKKTFEPTGSETETPPEETQPVPDTSTTESKKPVDLHEEENYE
jgi:hypothetical protein